MSGIPQRRIGDFLAMWSLGTLFGKTLKVDMKYAREKGVLRILVGCLDFRRIPAKERIFIADGFYDISFEVEFQRDLEMVTASNPRDEPSDNDGHGNNGDSTSKSPKNQDAMDTDSTLNLQDQEGANQTSTGGPDINKLAGEFSSGVKFSPKVKLMMEQSRIEISAFIASLSASAAAAEKPVEKTAETPPAPVAAPVISAAATALEAVSSAVARSVDFCCSARVAEAPAVGAEFLLVEAAASPPVAVEFGSAGNAAGRSAAATISATAAQIAVGHVPGIIAEATNAAASRKLSPISVPSTPISGSGSPVPAPPAADAVFAAADIPIAGSQRGSFRNSSKSAREVLRGPKTTCDVSHSAAETTLLPLGERTVGAGIWKTQRLHRLNVRNARRLSTPHRG
jgi:hypothetical protein